MLVAGPIAVPAYLLVRPTRAASWGVAEILAVTMLFAVAIPTLARAMRVSPSAPAISAVELLTVVQTAIFVGAALYVVRVKYRLPLAALGLRVQRWSRALLSGTVAGAAAIAGNHLGQVATVLTLGLVLGERAAAALVARNETSAPAVRVMTEARHPLELASLAVLVAVVVPVGEEMFFRGLVFGALRRHLRLHTAALASALFFAAAHLEPAALLPILLLGLVLAYTYEYTGSLIPGMIAHGINNLVALLVYSAGPPG